MTYSIKTSLLGWWFVFILAVFLWYRNYLYDRMIAAIAIVLGLFQLIEYGIFNNMNPHQGGKLIFSVLWLLVLILALTVLVYVKSIIALIWLIIISIVFVFAIMYAFTADEDVFNIRRSGSYLTWFREEDGMLKGLEWLYVFSIIIPIVLLMNYFDWTDIGLYAVIIYMVVSGLIVWYVFPPDMFGSMWVYSLIGIVMIVWFVGMFNP